MMNGGYGSGWGLGTWVAMGLMMLVFWGGVVTVVVLLLRRTNADGRTDPPRQPHQDAERILHERFARGEIDEDEYIARRMALRRSD